MKLRVIMTGRGYATAALPDTIELPDGANLSAALECLRRADEQVLGSSTLLIVSGRHAGSVARYDDLPLQQGDELLLLQPVAGG